MNNYKNFGACAWAVQADDISALNEKQLPMLLNILLAAEAQGHRVEYHVPQQIRARDRGQDGYWNYHGTDVDSFPREDEMVWRNEIRQFIPADEVVYQCKVVEENLTIGRFADEIFKNKKSGRFKEAVEKALAQGGAYVMLWSKQKISCNEAELRGELERRRKASGFALPDEVVIKALDANKIAEWTNRHPAAVLYVNGFRNPSMAFGQILDEWGTQRKFTTRFQWSPYLKGISEKIVSQLTEGKALIRVSGISGVGKSRFVYEILKTDLFYEKSSVFIDGSVLSEESLLGLLNYIKSNGIRTLLVVDDCPPALHDKLAAGVKDTKIKLITISSDSSQVGASACHYVLEAEEMYDVICQMLGTSAQFRSSNDHDSNIRILLKYVEGLPLVAEMLLELGRPMTPKEFMSRASVFRSIVGVLTPNANRVLRSLSIFSYIGGRHGNLYLQECSVREIFCGGLSESFFDDAVAELKEKNLLRYDPHFRTMRVIPAPLAAAVAAEYFMTLSEKTPERVNELFEQIKQSGLFSALIERLDDFSHHYALREITQVLESLFFYSTDIGYREEAKNLFLVLSKMNSDRALLLAERTCRYRLSLHSKGKTEASYSDLVDGLAELVWKGE